MINAVLSVVVLVEMTAILFADWCISKRLTDIEDKYRDLCDEYESLAADIDRIDEKRAAKAFDDTAEWVIDHIGSWFKYHNSGEDSVAAICELAKVRDRLKRRDKYSLSDRDVIVVNRMIAGLYKQLLAKS